MHCCCGALVDSYVPWGRWAGRLGSWHNSGVPAATHTSTPRRNAVPSTPSTHSTHIQEVDWEGVPSIDPCKVKEGPQPPTQIHNGSREQARLRVSRVCWYARTHALLCMQARTHACARTSWVRTPARRPWYSSHRMTPRENTAGRGRGHVQQDTNRQGLSTCGARAPLKARRDVNISHVLILCSVLELTA